MSEKQQHEVVIVGGGTAGITVAAHLSRMEQAPKIAIIEPSDKHYYQPIWTLVGGGVFDKEVSERDEEELIPDGVTWIRDSVASFSPDEHEVELKSGKRVGYEQLIVAPGIQLDWDKVEGLKGALGKDGVVSNYSYETVAKTWEALKTITSGRAIFTFPNTPIKCAGAPQKIMWLAEEQFRRRSVRKSIEVVYAAAGGAIFGIPRYRDPLQKLADERGVVTKYMKNLTAIRPKSKEAVFTDMAGGDEEILEYEMIHVTPPQSAPDFVKKSPLADGAGWVDVDKHTMQHVKYPDVFSLGDASSLPCSKTGAAVRKQAPILAKNLMHHRAGRKLSESYDGYASCPLVTGYGKLILAEFGYDGKIMETFPFAQNRERYSMYAMKAYALPQAYWHGMLRGRM
ncbi:MAG: NAD(P)/FAD-dependent oxidoreductase [Myxococcales bacterium]|nr:NAD(P)/FAD-dependent oxidoreductase [Myxococcales bacterium]